MENPNWHEYGLAYDQEYLEEFYKDVQDLLKDDSIYDSNDNDNFFKLLDKSWVQRLTSVITNIVMLVLAFILTFIIPFVSQGLLRVMYLLKTILLGVSNALIVAVALLWRQAYLPYIEQSTYDIVPPSVLVPQYLNEACATFAASLSCVVMHEIYACVTRMEARKPDVGYLAKMITAFGLTSFIVSAFYYLQLLVDSIWWQIFFTSGNPIMSLFALVSCVSCTYMGVRAWVALFKSGKMSSSSNGGHRKKWHIYAIVFVIVNGQWFQLICEVVKTIIVNANDGHCHEDELSSLAEMQKCEKDFARLRNLSLELHRSMAGVIESVGFTCIMIAKKCLNDAA